MKIAVVAGGFSTERDVSLSTGSMVCNALCASGHKTALVDSYLGLNLNGCDPESAFSTQIRPVPKVPEQAPDLCAVAKMRAGGQEQSSEAFFGPGVLDVCKAADKVFIALHGENGEDGRVQATLDLLGVPYTGTGYIGSALAMDKDLSKKLLKSGGVPTADWVYLQGGDLHAVDEIGLPCVVKPCAGGSSVGVVIANSTAERDAAIAEALRYGSGVLVEQYLLGREFSVGVLEGEAFEPIEIIPHEGFYDFKNKYQAGLTDEICPADITTDQKAELQRLALRTHQLLRLGSYSRVDFIFDGTAFFCLEANTLPGMTPTSLLPKEAAAQGISYDVLCQRIVMAK